MHEFYHPLISYKMAQISNCVGNVHLWTLYAGHDPRPPSIRAIHKYKETKGEVKVVAVEKPPNVRIHWLIRFAFT